MSAGQAPRWRLNLERQTPLEILYLLIPLSAVLVLAILGIFGWAVHRGQFEDLDTPALDILRDEMPPAERMDATPAGTTEERDAG